MTKEIKSILILFCLLLGSLTWSQKTKNIEGTIIIDIKEADPDGVYVVNSRTKNVAISDLTGGFHSEIAIGDTLQFKSDLYENRNIVINEALFLKDKIVIHLNLATIYLSQTTIMPWKYSGYLDKDVEFGKKPDVISNLYKNLGINPDLRPIQDTSRFSFGKDLGFTHLDVGRVFDIVSGNMRKRIALSKYEVKESKITRIRDYFGDKYFTTDLNIPPEKIREFVSYAYDMSNMSHFYENGNYFKILEQLNMISKIYLAKINKGKVEPSLN